MSADVSVTLDDDHVGTIELRRGPDNYIDTPLATAIADAIETFFVTHEHLWTGS